MVDQMHTPVDAVSKQKNALSAVNMILPEGLSPQISSEALNMAASDSALHNSVIDVAWQLHPTALSALQQGLTLLPSAHLLALGESTSGHAELVAQEVQHWCQTQTGSELTDLIAVDAFNYGQTAVLISLPAGAANRLHLATEKWLRQFQMKVIQTLSHRVETYDVSDIQLTFFDGLNALKESLDQAVLTGALKAHFDRIANEFTSFLATWQPSGHAEGDPVLELLLNDGVIGRYRINVLVSYPQTKEAPKPPFIVDGDPSLNSLFGGLDAASDQTQLPVFFRLRAGNLLRANGGVLLLHLRDLLADEQNGTQIIEKLSRFCRNGYLLLDDVAGGQLVPSAAKLHLQVKVILIASNDQYYSMLEDHAALFRYFSVKFEFNEHVKVSAQNYQNITDYIVAKSAELSDLSFSQEAVGQLLKSLHRIAEDQTRLSTDIEWLNELLKEIAALATSLQAEQVMASHVKDVLLRRVERHSLVEQQVRQTIVDQELMINVTGQAIGQVNGLTHIDLGEASFGSPIRISANCYPGRQGVVTIDREVTMSGPSHDKGVMIMQSWLQQHFAKFAPLNFTASLVFEQEYAGVDGDSASCAELFALMSALTQLPINQSIAVTGGLNQHGEVIPVGGLNDKIEGYFSVCRDIGLNGRQGVLIPEKNVRNLVLSDEVIAAVSAGHFKIATMSRVEEGFMYLMDTFMEDINRLAAERLKWFKTMIETNKPVANRLG